MNCGSRHPGRDVQCDRRSGNHPHHSAYDDGYIDWPNENYVRSKPSGGLRNPFNDARARKKLKDMATRTKEIPKPKFFPSESDRLGRVALYLRKYKGKWVSLEELELKTVGGTAANTSISTLINRYGWEIKAKVQGKDERRFVMLVSE